MSKSCLSICAITALLWALPAYADSEPQSADTVDGGRVFELRDTNEDSPPVNFRSNEDERYNTAKQHDAEMFAQQYERERLLKQQEDLQRLKDLDGFAAGARYRPGLGGSPYR